MRYALIRDDGHYTVKRECLRPDKLPKLGVLRYPNPPGPHCTARRLFLNEVDSPVESLKSHVKLAQLLGIAVKLTARLRDIHDAHRLYLGA